MNKRKRKPINRRKKIKRKPARRIVQPRLDAANVKPELLLQVYDQSLLDRITDGTRPLNKAELEYLKTKFPDRSATPAAGSAEGFPTTAKNSFEMAAIIGITKRWFNICRLKFPPAPQPNANGSWHVPEVLAWVRKNNINNEGDEGEDKTKKLIEERFQIDNEFRQMRNDKAKGKLFDIQTEVALNASGIIAAKTELFRIPSRVKDLEGLKAADMEKRLRAWIEAACKNLYAGPTPEMREMVFKVVEQVLALNTPGAASAA